MEKRILGCILTCVVAACSSDSSSGTTPDSTTPAPDVAAPTDGPLGENVAPGDTVSPTPDTVSPTPDGPAPPEDSSPKTDGGGPIDPGPVACRTDEDCGHNLVCLKHIPGGHCKGCGDGTPCPSDAFKCFQDICVRECQDDSDCNIGMRCLGTSHCAGRGCTAGCPTIYPCNYPLCERPKCDQGEPCPAPLTCDGEYCMEP